MCILCKNSDISHLTEIDCSGCKTLTCIPELPNIEFIQCSNCPQLTSIYYLLPNLTFLQCDKCPKLTSISKNFTNLTVLSFRNCNILTSIPSIYKMPKLTWFYHLGSPWIQHNKYYNYNIRQLLIIQKFYHTWHKKRALKIIHSIDILIPDVVNYVLKHFI
jgi:hypothetical protein